MFFANLEASVLRKYFIQMYITGTYKPALNGKHWGLCQFESSILRILGYDYNGTVFIGTGICKSTLICIKKIIKKYNRFYVWDNKCRHENENLKRWHILFV